MGLEPIQAFMCLHRLLCVSTSFTTCPYLLLILLPFYIGANLLIFKYEFFKGTGY